MHSDAKAAVYGALVAGLLGAAAVVYTGCQAKQASDRQVGVQKADVGFRKKADRGVAVGGARLLQTEYERRYEDIWSTLQRKRGGSRYGAFPMVRVSFGSAVTASDRRRVAAELTPEEWKLVARADIRLDRAQRLFDRNINKPVWLGEVDDLCDYSKRFSEAATALERLTARRPQLTGQPGGPPSCS